MHYKSVVLALGTDGAGVHEFSQGELSGRSGVVINDGACRGLVIDWLRAISDSATFWAPDTETKPLLMDKSRMSSSILTQRVYDLSPGDRTTLDDGTKTELAKSSLVPKTAGNKKHAYNGFDTNRDSIADHILATSPRYFILSIGGELGGHSIGVYRQMGFAFWNSSNSRVFDPNVGEFSLTSKTGLTKCFHALGSIVYKGKLDGDYYLWAFN